MARIVNHFLKPIQHLIVNLQRTTYNLPSSCLSLHHTNLVEAYSSSPFSLFPTSSLTLPPSIPEALLIGASWSTVDLSISEVRLALPQKKRGVGHLSPGGIRSFVPIQCRSNPIWRSLRAWVCAGVPDCRLAIRRGECGILR